MKAIAYEKEFQGLTIELNLMESIINFANQKHFESLLPPVIVSFQKMRGAYGHATTTPIYKGQKLEYYNIAIDPSHAKDDLGSLAPVIDTILHECIHLYCRVKGIEEVSNGGRYHNKKFAEIATRIGLSVEKFGPYGFNTINVLSGELIQDMTDDKAISSILLNSAPLFAIGESKTRPESSQGPQPQQGPQAQGGRRSPNSSNLSVYVCPICGLKARARKNAVIRCCFDGIEHVVMQAKQ
jgi:hypothetical protein